MILGRWLAGVAKIVVAWSLVGCTPGAGEGVPAAAATSTASPSPSRAPWSGHWQGAMIASGATLVVELDFAAEKSGQAGTFTALSQRAMDYPLDAVTVTGPAMHFVLGGDTTFEGQWTASEIAGTFKGEEASGTFRLRRANRPSFPYRVENVAFANGPTKLAGTLVEPLGKGPFPAVVLLQGSGPEVRWGTSRFIADRLARAGIAALIFDKRGSGESTGDWKTADYDDLARDALSGVAVLERRPEVDARRIGLHGHSQGGLVAANAARLAPDRVAFVVSEDTVAGPVWKQDLYRVRGALAREFPPEQAAAAMRVYELFVEVARGNQPFDALAAAEAEAATGKAPWLEWLALPPRESWLWAWYRKTGTIDTLAYFRAVRAPVLIVYGERDALVPVGESIAALESALDANGVSYTALIVPRAEHNLTIHPKSGEPFFWWRAAPGYYDTMAAWVKVTAPLAAARR